MAKKPLKGFPKSDAQKMLDRLSSPRIIKKFADGGFAASYIMTPAFMRPKDQAKRVEIKGQLDDYTNQVDAYNAALEKYNAEVYNPYKTQIDAYNTAAEAHNANPARGEFTKTIPTAPTAFAQTAPTAPLTQAQVDEFAKQAEARAIQSAMHRKTAIQAFENPDRFNLSSFGAGYINSPSLAGLSTSFAEGGEVDKESTASRMLKDIVPLDTRTFVSTLFGNRDPITERNLSPDQLTALREVVQTAEQKGRKGNVQYSDYEKFNQGPQHSPHISLSTTLGRFNYTQNPDGSLTVVDRYDFANPGREEAIKAYEAMGPARKALEVAKRTAQKPFAFPLSLASELGNAYIGREGRDVKITVPPSDSGKMLKDMKKPPKK
jgi:hypothetical protein